MLIGELVQKTGYSKDTIRFYEKQGLIKIGKRDRRANNYKEYPESVLADLLTIKRLKNLGFTLTEISEFLLLARYKLASCDHMSEAMIAKLRSIDDKIAELNALREQIKNTFEEAKYCCAEVFEGENCGFFVSVQ